MIRVGFVGAESYHTSEFIEIIQKDYPDCEITAIVGENEEILTKVCEKFNLKCGVKNISDMIGMVDVVFITLRDGAMHLKAAEQLVEHNIAIWIDKPFTATVEDAKKLISLLEKNNTIFSGGSYVKSALDIQNLKHKYTEVKETCMSGYMSFWLQPESPYNGIHFYSHHLIECVLEIFGCNVESIYAKRTQDSIVAIAGYDTINVIMNYGVGQEPFDAGIFGKSDSLMTKVSYDGAGKLQLKEFIQAVRNKKSPYDTEFFLTTVKISNAIVKSIDERREVRLEELENV